jgi:hypothetical protein
MSERMQRGDARSAHRDGHSTRSIERSDPAQESEFHLSHRDRSRSRSGSFEQPRRRHRHSGSQGKSAKDGPKENALPAALRHPKIGKQLKDSAVRTLALPSAVTKERLEQSPMLRNMVHSHHMLGSAITTLALADELYKITCKHIELRKQRHPKYRQELRPLCETLFRFATQARIAKSLIVAFTEGDRDAFQKLRNEHGPTGVEIPKHSAKANLIGRMAGGGGRVLAGVLNHILPDTFLDQTERLGDGFLRSLEASLRHLTESAATNFRSGELHGGPLAEMARHLDAFAQIDGWQELTGSDSG